MKFFYIFVITCFIICAFIFIAAFFYLDKEKHAVYYYTIIKDGHNIGTVTLDKFSTEDKMIYKSISRVPFGELYTEFRDRIDMDQKQNLQTFVRERSADNVIEGYYLESNNGLASFVSNYNAEFAYLNTYAVGKRAVFEISSLVTYLPIIENYDFRIGRSQGFNVLLCLSDFSLPPIKTSIAFTSILDEYLKIDRRKIKTEKLILRLKDYPQASVWVAKSDRTIMKMEIPGEGLTIIRSFGQKNVTAKERSLQGSSEYSVRDVEFKDKNVVLSGSMAYPKKEGKYPAVLLVWGAGPQSMDYQGFFLSMSEYFSKNGYVVLRFDKQGVGKSSGSFQSAGADDQARTICAAADFLASQKEVDASRIAILSHAEGALYAAKAIKARDAIKAAVFMAPYIAFSSEDDRIKKLNATAAQFNWPADYMKNATRSMLLTLDIAKNANRSWVTLLRRKCFTEDLRNELAEDRVELIKNIKVPVMILQGKKDENIRIEKATDIDKLLSEGGNQSHGLKYFSYLGNFFGTKINDGVHRISYTADPEVLETIRKWLDKALPEAPPAKPAEANTDLQAVVKPAAAN